MPQRKLRIGYKGRILKQIYKADFVCFERFLSCVSCLSWLILFDSPIIAKCHLEERNRKPPLLSARSSQQFLADLGRALGPDQLVVQALIGIDEPPGIEAQQMQDRGLKVVDGDGVLGDVIA